MFESHSFFFRVETFNEKMGKNKTAAIFPKSTWIVQLNKNVHKKSEAQDLIILK